MEKKLTILKPFFENPNREFHIRELSRMLKINHTTVRQYLNKFVKENLLEMKKERKFKLFKAKINRKFLNLKLFYNLEKIRKSGLIEDLERNFDFPPIVIFGSYAQAMDNKNSDIDICIITNIKKKFNTTKYEKKLNRKLSLHIFSEKEWEKLKVTNPELVNSICNGIVLAGQLEVVK